RDDDPGHVSRHHFLDRAYSRGVSTHSAPLRPGAARNVRPGSYQPVPGTSVFRYASMASAIALPATSTYSTVANSSASEGFDMYPISNRTAGVRGRRTIP